MHRPACRNGRVWAYSYAPVLGRAPAPAPGQPRGLHRLTTLLHATHCPALPCRALPPCPVRGPRQGHLGNGYGAGQAPSPDIQASPSKTSPSHNPQSHRLPTTNTPPPKHHRPPLHHQPHTQRHQAPWQRPEIPHTFQSSQALDDENRGKWPTGTAEALVTLGGPGRGGLGTLRATI